MATEMPGYYSCEICGSDSLSDAEMRKHMMECHIRNAVSCPFCDLSQITQSELAIHVNSAHLDYLSPESERDVMAFIDDDDLSPREVELSNTPRPHNSHKENINNNNNNNNVEFFEDRLKNGESWGSPQRSQLALNLRPQSSALRCPLCVFSHHDATKMEQHINRQHFDLTSPSLPVESPTASNSDSLYSCPLCVRTFENTPDLELHVNIEHKDILSPANATHETGQEKGTCPICCMGNFKTTEELASHIEDHFSQKGISPMTPDVSADRLLAKEMEKRDKEVQRLREQHEFQLLRAQYGMDNEGNFKEQSLTNMQRAVYSGELSVADYYERQVELKMAESTGVDDSSSCTRDIVPLVTAVSSSSSNVMRVHLCTTVDHYASTYGDKGWGCGYRNMQMMLSSLFHHTGFNETLFRQWTVVGGRSSVPSRSAMPSISRLQACVEWGWSQGFDTQGSEQLGGCLANTRKWIGATEVVTVLSSLRMRCQLVDFHRPTSPNGSHPDLFSWVLNYFQSYNEFKPPLYLQHQGHSRTIIGVEELRDGGLNLLVLDPSHSPQQIGELRCTLTSANAMRLIRKGYGAMKAKQYQVVAVTGIMETELEYQRSKILRSERIPQDR